MRRLERLLLDEDIEDETQECLEAVGFRTLWAGDQPDINIHDDVDVLKWARKHRCIYVCHDKHKKPQDTKIRLNLELRENGGRILRIAGATGEDAYTVAGKIIAQREIWKAFFDIEKDGTVSLGLFNHPVKKTRKDLDRVLIHVAKHSPAEVAAAVKGRKRPHNPSKRKSRKISEYQKQMEFK